MGKSRHASQRNRSASRSPYAGLWLVLAIYLVLSLLTSLVVPLTQGEDELAHYRYINFIVEHGRLPLNDQERQQAWYRADWPPLYHLLVAALVSPLDTTRPPLKDVGDSPRRRLVGEIFYPRLLIYTEDLAWPWQDGVLAWYLGRFTSILLAGGALVLCYLTALELGREVDFLPAPWLFAPAVTALLAFMPRFLFTSAMLGDDSLLILLSAAFIWLLLRALWGNDSWLLYILMGLLLGFSIATKYSTGLLPLAIIPVIWWRAKRMHWSWPQWLGRLALAWSFTLLAASWWFGWIALYFNTIKEDGLLIGLLSPLLAAGPDVSMRRVFTLLGGQSYTGALRPDAVAEGTLTGWGRYLFQTFWGVPILEQDYFPPWAYLAVGFFCLICLFGLYRCWRAAASLTRMSVAVLALIVLLLLPFPVLRFFLTYNILETGQGRHILYPAAQSIPILLMLGWFSLSRFKLDRADDTKRHGVAVAVPLLVCLGPAMVLLGCSVLQLGAMVKVYPPPLPVRTTTFDAATIPQPLKRDFGESIQLLGYDYRPDSDQAIINLTLYWRALQPVDQNYRTRVQLTDPAGQVRFTWLSHPLSGRYPTRAWDQGDVIRDELPLPLAGLPPNIYDLQLDLLHEANDTPLNPEPLQFIQFELPATPPIANATPYDQNVVYRLWGDTGQARPRQTIPLSWTSRDPNAAGAQPAWSLVGPDGESYAPAASSDATSIFLVGSNWPGGHYYLAGADGAKTPQPVLTVVNEARLDAVPPVLLSQPGWTPLEANFAGVIKLLGYALPSRQTDPGRPLPLYLAWQSLAPVLTDTVTFAVLLDEQQQPYGHVDRYAQGFYSPMLWSQGEVVADEFQLPVQTDAPPGVYYIHLGQYQQSEGKTASLPLLHQGQPTGSSAVVLGPIKVGGPPADTVIQAAAPQVSLNQSFAGQITLLGYTIEAEQGANDPALRLSLFWQAETVPDADYTTFLHVRNSANETVAQQDGPPAGGRYPSSLWSPGEIIRDEIVLSLSDISPGDYTLVAGLYNLASGERLPTPGNPANEIHLQPLRIEPGE